jgi:SAM-dependent methyltransferase
MIAVMAELPPLYTDLSFNAPLSDTRAAGLIERLRPLDNARVVDIGCGWAELLLRVAAAEPSVTAAGIDTSAASVEHGRRLAGERGLADRIELTVGDASGWEFLPADVGICVGASHAWGGTAQALRRMRAAVRPGGRALFGEGIWLRPPTPAATDALGGDPAEFGTLADLVDLALAAGFRPLEVAEASPAEWDAFESGYARGWERWLLANPGHAEVDAVRAEADQHRQRWLRGYRGILGFAYLVLV